MSFLNQAINVNDLPDDEKSLIPSGVYSVVISEAELKTTNSGTGQYISLKLKVVGGQYSNRVIFDMININNPNPTAQNIGLATLKKIMKAMQLDSVQNTDQLVGGNLVVKVGVELSDEYGDKNKVKDYQSAGGNIAPPPANDLAAMSMGQVAQPAPPAHTQMPRQQQAPAPAQAYTQAPGFSDDIPF